MQRMIGKMVSGCLLAGALTMAMPAQAFLPAGGFDSFDTLRFRTFPLSEFDTNSDGQVGPDEGLEIWVEAGPRGFTPAEFELVKKGLQVWEDVPTSYASFGKFQQFQDILDLASAAPDGLSTISLQVGLDDVVEEGQEPDSVDDVTSGLLGVTTTIYTLDESLVPIRGGEVIIPAGTIIDSDMIINASVHRRNTPNEELVEFEATSAVLGGLFLGLSFTPLNNLREIDLIPDNDEPEGLIESEVLGLTGTDGVQKRIGATPTMFPAYFQVDDFESNSFIGGQMDLAPDDISGISWLYPQGSQANFFEIAQEARTQTRPGSNIPTNAISGGHIVVWADADNDPSTPRVPLFNSMTGLYIHPIDEALLGRFEIIGMWKQLEIPGTAGVRFTPSYTITLNAFNATGLDRQAPGGFLPGSTPDFFDSISGSSSLTTVVGGQDRAEKEYDTSFPSEVYQEIENITDISNKDAGTPLIWNFERNTVISNDTGKTIAQLLPLNRPMFGDANDVCPLNIITGTEGGTEGGITDGGDVAAAVAGRILGGGSGGSGPGMLRAFRDQVLLNSTLGTAIVNGYYRVAPVMAKLLLRYTDAIAPARAAVNAFYWVLSHGREVFAGGIALAVILWLYRRHSRRAMAASLLLGAVLLGVQTAPAQILYVNNQTLVQRADLIVEGVITSENARWSGGGRIYTDYTLTVGSVVKSPAAAVAAEGESDTTKAAAPAIDEGDTVPFTVLGGQIGSVVMTASPLPTFDEGDEVVLHFVWKNNKWIVLDGERGKVEVATEGDTKYVAAAHPAASLALEEAAKQIPGSKQSNEESAVRVTLDDYLAYLSELVATSEK